MHECTVCGGPTPPVYRRGKVSPTEHRQTCSIECRAESKRRTRIALNAAVGSYRTGPAHPLWKGRSTKNGYVTVRPQDYSFPESLDRTGRIYEHRMVMETHIGRPLRRDEVVHHINGVKTDNRPVNLELTTQVEHMRSHAVDGTLSHRWPKCVMGCGRQSKPLNGTRFLACCRCRRMAGNATDPRIFLVQ